MTALADKIIRYIWASRARQKRPLPLTIRLLRMVHVISKDVAEGMITLRAMGLVYTSLLSLVPLIAVSFSVLKAFGAHNQVEPFLLNFLSPLGPQAADVTERIIGFVENIKTGVLGSLGLALLLYTVVSLIQKTEDAFNRIWHVKHHRPLSQRFSEYLSVVMIGPILIFSAMGLTASITNTDLVLWIASMEPFGALFQIIARLMPLFLVITAFTVLFGLIPNTEVRFTSALTGGVTAGALWQGAGWGFAMFVANSSNFTAIYSAFATLILFMIWLYVSWLILLLGASVAFYHQHPERCTLTNGELQLAPRLWETLALSVMSRVVRGYYRDEPPLNAKTLSRELGAPPDVLELAMEPLLESGYLIETQPATPNNDAPPGLIPGKPPEQTPLSTLIHTLRRHNEQNRQPWDSLYPEPQAMVTIERIEEAIDTVLEGETVRDLAKGPAKSR
ncbi:MAG: YihY/virulence factor BrkB family protein [Magnetococcales bacterium]|nr:YihY/virulence factor BrkB family protein [Magnetococcales bacterium]